MGARDLLGQPVEPFVSEDPPATIPLKVPLFAQVLPVLRDLSAHTFQMMRLWKGITAQDGSGNGSPFGHQGALRDGRAVGAGLLGRRAFRR